MKKILTITLSLLLLLSTTACSLNLGFNSSKYELTGECEKKSVKNNPSMIEYK